MAIDYTSDIGKVRLTIGDLNESEFLLTDDQIQGFIDMTGNVVLASMSACLALMGIYASTSGDKYRIDTIEYEEGKSKVNQLQGIYDALKKSVESGMNTMLFGVPFTTGLYVQDKIDNLQRIYDGEIVGPQIHEGEYDVVDLDNQDGPYYG